MRIVDAGIGEDLVQVTHVDRVEVAFARSPRKLRDVVRRKVSSGIQRQVDFPIGRVLTDDFPMEA